MVQNKNKKRRSRVDPKKVTILVLAIILIIFVSAKVYTFSTTLIASFLKSNHASVADSFLKPTFPEKIELDKADYDLRMNHLAHKFDLNDATSTANFKELLKLNASSSSATSSSLTISSSTASSSLKSTLSRFSALWPAKDTAYPLPGAILPFKRVIAFYGNLYSKKMGILGEYEPDEVLSRLDKQAKEWEKADPATPVQPALHYIAVVAQGSAGKDGKYRARMPDAEIEKVLEMAKKIDAIVFLDVQVALSDLQSELPPLTKYLSLPNVHLGIDPEFSMKTGKKPGSVIGTFDASDINYAATFLADIVQKNNIPPKILTFYRFTRNMVTNYKNIKTIPEVQMVHAMDGWGHHARKVGTYNLFVGPEPIQFAGFKLFYKNDLKQEGSRLMTPSEVIKLTPAPIYIQYQ